MNTNQNQPSPGPEDTTPTLTDTQLLETSKAMAEAFYQAMRGLVLEMRLTPKVKGKAKILQTYNKAKAIALTYRIDTPPLKDKTERVVLFNHGNNEASFGAPAKPEAPPVMAPEVVYDGDPAGQDLQEIKDYQRQTRRGRPSKQG